MGEQKGGSFKLNVGLPSIILLLCVLGLSMFAVLTVRAGYNGLKNARTSKTAIQEYYKAEVEADKTRLKIASVYDECILKKGLGSDEFINSVSDIDGVECEDEGNLIILTYNTRVNDYSSICTQIDIIQNGTAYSFNTVSHKLVVEDMDGYSGTGFEIEEIELF
ncbi:MAG: hypothetical protein K6E85_17365 [Lachnospiraceae bacterium]|nr:hypothetical protein [Lachnospiraceae bacterium]